MLHEFQIESNDKEGSLDEDLLHDLCRIYYAENYCLRRIPRLVNLIESPSLANLLSDHVSKIMDRLNLLDEIFEEFKTRPSTLKVLPDSQNHSMRIFLLKDDKGNQKLVSELIKASQYRYSLYELLLNSSSEKAQTTIYNMLINSLNEESYFYQELITIKRNLLSNSETQNIHIAESA